MSHHAYFQVLLLSLLVAGCGRKSSPPSAEVAPAPPLVDAGAAEPSPAEREADAGPVEVPAVVAERSCEVRWTLAAAPGRTVLGGALAGHVAAILFGTAEGFALLLVAGEPPELRAVRLPGWPDPDGPCGAAPAGAVASHGDRFLAAYGPAGPERLALRLRAVSTAKGLLIPVNAPGAPGSDGAPVLELPLPDPAARPELWLHVYPQGVLLAAAIPGFEPPTGAVVWRTSTGAPASEDVVPWRLGGPSSAALLGPWRLGVPGAADHSRYVGPLGRFALGLTDAGLLVRLPAEPGRESFAFADGWVPEPGAAVGFGNERLVREEPRAGGRPLAVVYDAKGEVRARLGLPAGHRPFAVSRDPGELLVLGPGGEPALCVVDQPPRLPARIDPGAALTDPGTGSTTCGR